MKHRSGLGGALTTFLIMGLGAAVRAYREAIAVGLRSR